MEKVVLGIIAEYNPLHLGHLHHLTAAREACQADRVIVVMSGPFTQRGDAALFSPRARAEMALWAGADMVFELPTLFAVREADYFAKGGVSLLTQLGCTHIAFGCENDDLALFSAASELIANPSEAFNAHLHSALARGCSHAKAQGVALSRLLQTDALSLPNNVLALCYLSAIRHLKSGLIPVPIKRIGSYHDVSPTAFPSATALRAAILRGDWAAVCRMTSKETHTIICRELEQKRVHPPDALNDTLRAMLLTAGEEQLSSLPGVSEGLDRLLMKHKNTFVSRESLLTLLKSKRYTYTRLNRLLTHLMLGITADALIKTPPYARLLGLKAGASGDIRLIKQGGLPIIEKAADYSFKDASFDIDMRGYDLWALGASLPFGEGYRQSPIVLNQ